MEFMLQRVKLRRLPVHVAVHVPCSLKKDPRQGRLVELATLCAEKVTVAESVPCCGFAGDKGFITPELTASALV